MKVVYQIAPDQAVEFEGSKIEMASDHCVVIWGDDPSGYVGPDRFLAVIHLAPGQYVRFKAD